mmetsp:Transcript_26405/g.44226  ORF Transcript_26405/g.44226 Transcript_26405/m.44226 type:complete len:133 (+) Transcript_26405:232-630(+)|eukprot:CAMPEP_0198212470 /NCGR_PEP_ID=MMETSP1445-20131203/26207_1 /TAXON_ID=36898 /ORGANISM="Pyramimonas sp., Strain CCMP2087" /LENGTH=132 /DNA_ID=CAMNT_0043886923 /DNA_START=232 /DNA_END=630 /DNA_ORIENTATION=+
MSKKAKAGASKPAAEEEKAPAPGVGLKRKRGLFTKDLRPMLYGFGDVANPLPETVELMEELVVDYVTDMMHKAIEGCQTRGRLTHQDLVFLVRKDYRKYSRCLELLDMQEELKRARKNFDFDEAQFKDDKDE